MREMATTATPSLLLSLHSLLLLRQNNNYCLFSSRPPPRTGGLRLKSRACARAPPTAQDESFSVLANLSSCYNHIVIVDTPQARLLLLDPTHNIHSMRNKNGKWTSSYWDEFAALPAIVPQGPIAILGRWNSGTFDARNMACFASSWMGDR